MIGRRIRVLAPHPDLPADTRLWAALQAASGGVWAGCVYDVDKIIEALRAGMVVLKQETEEQPSKPVGN